MSRPESSRPMYRFDGAGDCALTRAGMCSARTNRIELPEGWIAELNATEPRRRDRSSPAIRCRAGQRALQEEWDRTGGFDEAYMHAFLKRIEPDPGHIAAVRDKRDGVYAWTGRGTMPARSSRLIATGFATQPSARPSPQRASAYRFTGSPISNRYGTAVLWRKACSPNQRPAAESAVRNERDYAGDEAVPVVGVRWTP